MSTIGKIFTVLNLILAAVPDAAIDVVTDA